MDNFKQANECVEREKKKLAENIAKEILRTDSQNGDMLGDSLVRRISNMVEDYNYFSRIHNVLADFIPKKPSTRKQSNNE